MSKEEYSRSYHKKRLKNFWKTRWIPGRSVQLWSDVIGISSGGWGRNHLNARTSTMIILDAVEKLYLEKKLSEDEKVNIINMIKSPDEESRYTALSILYNLKPKAFERRKK
jgi:hypothetical protein